MKTKPIWLIAALYFILIVWLYVDLKHGRQIDYNWHSYLINSTTGEKIKPRDYIDLSKLVNTTDEAYLNSTNSIQRLYDFVHNVHLESPLINDDEYSDEHQLALSGWPVSNQTKCANELQWISEKLDEHPNYLLLNGRLGYELTRFMDSFGKLESNFALGLLTWPGSYRECLEASLDDGRIKTRYCFAKMRFGLWPQNEGIDQKTRIKVGVCLPETCDTTSFAEQKRTIDALVKFNLNQFYRDNLELESMFCLPDERSPIRRIPLSGHILLYIMAGWLLLVLVSSILYEIIKGKQRKLTKKYLLNNSSRNESALEPSCLLGQNGKTTNLSQGICMRDDLRKQETLSFKLVEALSIHKSIKDFKSNLFAEQKGFDNSGHYSNDQKIRIDMSCLDSLKFVMAILVVLGHGCYMGALFMRALAIKVDWFLSETGLTIMSVGRVVDTFFLIFGMLASFSLLSKFSMKQLSSPISWFAYNLIVLVRIVPAFALFYWYSTSISAYMASGPSWDYGVYNHTLKGMCHREEWWKMFPYFGHMGSTPSTTCVPHGWFLVNYIQISFVLPLIIYAICKLPGHCSKIGFVLSISFISSLYMTLKMYQQTTFRNDSFSAYGGLIMNLMEKFESNGTMDPMGRIGCVSIGCYVGYLLRMYKVGKIRNWPKWLTGKLTILIAFVLHILIIILPVIGHRLGQKSGHETNLKEFVGGFLATSFLWSTINAILIINAVTVYNRTAIVRFFGHSFWHSANKLGFAIYLLHWEVLIYGLQSYEHGQTIGFKIDIIKLGAFTLFFSIMFSFFFYIVIEAPINALTGLIRQRLLPSPEAKKEDKNGERCVDC